MRKGRIGGLVCLALLLSVLAAPAMAGAKLAWVIGETVDDAGNPKSTLGLRVGTRTYELRPRRTVGYSPIEPGAWKVPPEAEIACLGWWAGSGEVLYALRNGEAVEIYLRRIEETEEEPVGHLLKRIPLE